MLYAFTENFVLPISHDEVVHLKKSLLSKMPGDEWQKFANLRLLYGYMFTHPGKKLLFMGAEIGQWDEWNHETSLDWHLLAYDRHQGIKKIVRDLNFLYRNEKALHNLEISWECFEWVNMYDSDNSVISFYRKDPKSNEVLLVICNFTPIPRENYTLGINRGGHWKEIFNSDAAEYGGTNQWRYQTVEARNDSNAHLFTVTLPPLSTMVFKQLL
jgi:1,4-alpha-glucan branching enzyme